MSISKEKISTSKYRYVLLTLDKSYKSIATFASLTVLQSDAHHTRDSPRTFNDPRANCLLFSPGSKLAICALTSGTQFIIPTRSIKPRYICVYLL